MFFSLEKVMQCLPEEYVADNSRESNIVRKDSVENTNVPRFGFVFNAINYADLGESKMIFDMADDDIVNFIVDRPSYFDFLLSSITTGYIYDDVKSLEEGHFLWNIMLLVHEQLTKMKLDQGIIFPSLRDHFAVHQLYLRFHLRLSYNTMEEHRSVTKCLFWLNENYHLSKDEKDALVHAPSIGQVLIDANYYVIGHSFHWIKIVTGYYDDNLDDLIQDISDYSLESKEHVMALFAIDIIRNRINDKVIYALNPLLEDAFRGRMSDIAYVLTEINNAHSIDSDEE